MPSGENRRFGGIYKGNLSARGPQPARALLLLKSPVTFVCFSNQLNSTYGLFANGLGEFEGPWVFHRRTFLLNWLGWHRGAGAAHALGGYMQSRLTVYDGAFLADN